MFTSGRNRAFECLMQETAKCKCYDSGKEGILPECRTCRFHRPFWKYQSCVFKICPYSSVPVTTIIITGK